MATQQSDLYAAFWFSRGSTPAEVYLKLQTRYPNLTPQEYQYHTTMGGLIVAGGKAIVEDQNDLAISELVDPRVSSTGNYTIGWQVQYETTDGASHVVSGRNQFPGAAKSFWVKEKILEAAASMGDDTTPGTYGPVEDTYNILSSQAWDEIWRTR